MSERVGSPYDSIARKWLALVERRQAHFLELCDTGRWRHYYTEPEFLDEMRKVLRVRDRWAMIAGLPRTEEPDGERLVVKAVPRSTSVLDRLNGLLSADDIAVPAVSGQTIPAKTSRNGLPAAHWPE